MSDEEAGQIDSNKMALGIAFGPLLGFALGLALNNIGIGIAVGMGLGTAVGMGLGTILGVVWGLT
ncbi:hypothetical protein ACFQL7_28550 [Halocatena marina]|uniref:Glycine zipper family protein n=1 Tax=Halocatena marina TaxID=2934937 RepID=A0ABD5YVL1_9EURY|nr:hypothetical protein [Halocatena marina]